MGNQTIYIETDGVRFRKPSDSMDCIETLTKGQPVSFVDGPWMRVTKDGKTGWVSAEYLSATAPSIPTPTAQQIKFEMGKSNQLDGKNTVAVRKIIKDVFGNGQNGYCLQCTEYVEYRVGLLGIEIQWPVTNGRNGGKWASIFKTANLYHILDFPLPNCAMCLTKGISQDPSINTIGHVAFVEQVFPDGSVKISEANWPNSGIYNERTIQQNKWQNQYKAQFVYFQ